MFDDQDNASSAVFSATAIIMSVAAAGIMTFCTPQPAQAVTLDQCAVHATFAYILRDPTVTPDVLQAWVLEQDAENHDAFQHIAELAIDNLDAVRSMTPQQFSGAVFQLCERAVEEDTL